MTNPIPPLGCRCSGGTRGDRGITDAAPTNGGGGVGGISGCWDMGRPGLGRNEGGRRPG